MRKGENAVQYQVAILSEDAVFARMLELEFSLWHLKVTAAPQMQTGDRADVLILDLDSATAPAPEAYRQMVGFSRRPATASEDARLCSMILHRPFQIALLRKEVFSKLSGEKRNDPAGEEAQKAARREVRLEVATGTLFCDGKNVAVTPQEARILQCLLERRGKPVTRRELSDVIGVSAGNKTDVYICYLRRKTDTLPGGRLIATVRGEGYRIE